MPPDDNLFPEGSPPAEEPKTGGDPPNGSPTPTPLTVEAATEMIAPLVQRLEELGQTNAALAAKFQQAAPAPPAADPPPVNGDDFLTQLSTDPRGAIAEVVRSEFKGISPLISTLINSGSSAFTGLEAEQIDRDFGPGAWDKFFDKPMGQLLDAHRQNNPAALADRNVINREVNGLKGALLDDLVEFRDEARKTATERGEADTKTLVDAVSGQVRTNMTGGIRRVDTGIEEVTEDLKGYLAERERAIGEKNDPKAWLEKTDYGNTIEDFQAHQEKLKKAAGATT